MEYYHVDTFTDVPFSGNPTVVCIDTRGLEDTLMQKIAVETNQTETVFLSNIPGGSFTSGDQFIIRWFSPTCEVNLCGHGTVAAALVLSQIYNNPNATITYNTLSGELKTVFNKDNTISLSLPNIACEPVDVAEHHAQEFAKITIGNLPALHYCYSMVGLKLLIRLEDTITRDQLERLTPDTGAMMGINQNTVKGIIVTLKANEGAEESCGYDFFSRYFTPWYGNPEDYVTGAAHTVLGPYWSGQLHKDIMRARQCSSRGGDLGVVMDRDNHCVILTGRAKIIIRGTLYTE